MILAPKIEIKTGICSQEKGLLIHELKNQNLKLKIKNHAFKLPYYAHIYIYIRLLHLTETQQRIMRKLI